MKANKVFIIFLITVFIFGMSPVSFAQEEEVPPQAEQAGDVTSPELEKVSAPGNVTLIFKDADIRSVLSTLSYKSGVNIVAASDVEGKVTIRLVDVPWETALDVILKNNGLTYEKVGNIIRVITLASVAEEELQNELFTLNYSKAKDVAETIKDTLTERGKVKYDERTNTVVITDIPTNLHKIRQVVERLDKGTQQVYIEAKIIETTIDDDEKLGIDWTVQVTATGAKLPTTVPFTRNLSNVGADLKKRMPLGDTSSAATSTIGPFPTGAAYNPQMPKSVPANFTFGTLDFSSFQGILYALNTRSDTKVVSNPRTVTLDNQEAIIHVGTTIFVPQFTESTNTGSPIFQDMKKTELQSGIKLKVTPHVNSKDEIVVDVVPEVSTLGTKSALLTTSGGSTVYAWPLEIRTAKAQVMVKDGETIAMGGLLKEEKVKVRNKVPLLGDIPFLGNLFRYSYDTVDTKDLLIFITVRLVKGSSDTQLPMGDIKDRMDKMEHAPTTFGNQYEPDTPIGTGKKKKDKTPLILQ